MKKYFLISALILTGSIAYSGIVPVKDAEKVAKSHYYQSFNSAKSGSEGVKWDDINLTLHSTSEKGANFNFYVFDVNENNGFIVISSESKIKPVLAYSFEGSFNSDDMSPAQKEFFDYYSDCMEYASTNNINIIEGVTEEWKELLEFSPSKGYEQKSTSQILLEGINWNQTWPYNSHCPEDSRSDFNGRVPVGCVATSMVQIMKYYNWPPSGTGIKYHSYGGYDSYNINFSEESYDWSSIPDVASSQVNDNLGKINLHAGVAVNMMWGPEGSGSYTESVPAALKNYFRFSSDVEVLSRRQNTSEESWKNSIREQLDAKKPIIYAGSSTKVGHAWNCDGYLGDEFHMNWGWGGSGNCYCTLDKLISSATAGGEEDNFINNQRIVVNILPESSSYPEYCTGLKTITGSEGSFDDGSSIYGCKPNSSCVYTILPDCGTVVTCSFSKFDLGEGDNVDIYDGDVNSDVLLASFDSNNLPSGKIIGENGAITIRFNTGESSVSDGWKLNYSIKTCADNLRELTAPSGKFEDGSNSCDYVSGMCSWKICPPGASKIKISFDKFDLALYDELRIHKNTLSVSDRLYTFKSSNVPVGEYTIDAETVIVRFYASAASAGAEGWNISYTTGLLDVEEYDFVSDFKVIPNPGNENSKLIFNINNGFESAVITITDVLGKVISSKDVKLLPGVNELTLKDITTINLNNGVYYINIHSKGQIKTTKFIILN